MNWYKNIFYKFAFGTENYSIPQNPKEMLYDFYILNLLPDSEYGFKGELIYKNPELLQEIKLAKSQILQQLKNKFLEDVFFTICCELRHLWQNEQDYHDMLSVNGIRQYNKPLSGKAEEYRKILLKFRDDFYKNSENQQKYKNIITESKGIKSGYDLAFLAGKETPNKYEFIKAAELAFQNGRWEESYGGESWAEICDAWLKLYQAKDQNSVSIWIDHIFDLQHNTGTIFNKLKDYQINNSFNWINISLDHKKNIVSPYELLTYTSPKIKHLAMMALKDSLGTSYSEQTNNLSNYWKGLIIDNPQKILFLDNKTLQLINDKEFLTDILLKELNVNFFGFSSASSKELISALENNKLMEFVNKEKIKDFFKNNKNVMPAYVKWDDFIAFKKLGILTDEMLRKSIIEIFKSTPKDIFYVHPDLFTVFQKEELFKLMEENINTNPITYMSLLANPPLYDVFTLDEIVNLIKILVNYNSSLYFSIPSKILYILKDNYIDVLKEILNKIIFNLCNKQNQSLLYNFIRYLNKQKLLYLISIPENKSCFYDLLNTYSTYENYPLIYTQFSEPLKTDFYNYQLNTEKLNTEKKITEPFVDTSKITGYSKPTPPDISK